MRKIQTWVIVIVLFLLTIGVYLNALTGRYQFFRPDNPQQCIWPCKFDTWTGNHYVMTRDGNWQLLFTFKDYGATKP